MEPFDNQAVLVTLSGPDLAELKKIASSRSGDFFTGPRIIDLDRTYTVATSDFLANETASYSILTRGEITYLGQPVRQILEIYLQERVLDVQPKASSF